tara:strand:- start:408 stop:590 length:183 start_codon:yes stop_codon:yes gene_type:complete
MKKEFIELLLLVQEKTGDSVAHFQYHSDHSGILVVHGEPEFSFDCEAELKQLLKEFTSEK